VDIEEAKNPVDTMPQKAEAMNRRLTDMLTEMKASLPYYNPAFGGAFALAISTLIETPSPHEIGR
jgi:hypothetical protein